MPKKQKNKFKKAFKHPFAIIVQKNSDIFNICVGRGMQIEDLCTQ